MPLVNAKCTNCGGTLSVDASKDAAICDFCGSPFIVEKAIQNYNYHITNNITAQNVIIAGKGEMEKERLLQNAKTQLEFKDYATARSIFQEVSTDYPDDYRAWYGMASIDTENFTKVDLSAVEFQQVRSFMDRAIMTPPPSRKAEISKCYEFLNNNKAYINKLESKSSKIEEHISNLNERINANKQKLVLKTDATLVRLLIVLAGIGIGLIIISLISAKEALLAIGALFVIGALCIYFIKRTVNKTFIAVNRKKINEQIDKDLAKVSDLQEKNNSIKASIAQIQNNYHL